MIEHPSVDVDSMNFWDVVEVLRFPALFAITTAAITWLIWYYTSTLCTLEIAGLTGCNPARIARYINIDIFGRMLTYSALVGGIGGLWQYDMIRKERAARIAAQKQLAELQRQWQEERERAAQQAAEERQAFLAALSDLTAELAHLRQQRNGDTHNGQ